MISLLLTIWEELLSPSFLVVIVDALIRAHDDGMDIITLSLGGPDGWTEGTASVVASRIAAQGKVVTIASGNDGTVGSWYTSAPGNAVNAISVASVDKCVEFFLI